MSLRPPTRACAGLYVSACADRATRQDGTASSSLTVRAGQKGAAVRCSFFPLFDHPTFFFSSLESGQWVNPARLRAGAGQRSSGRGARARDAGARPDPAGPQAGSTTRNTASPWATSRRVAFPAPRTARSRWDTRAGRRACRAPPAALARCLLGGRHIRGSERLPDVSCYVGRRPARRSRARPTVGLVRARARRRPLSRHSRAGGAGPRFGHTLIEVRKRFGNAGDPGHPVRRWGVGMPWIAVKRASSHQALPGGRKLDS
jgi:hypothetical protein